MGGGEEGGGGREEGRGKRVCHLNEGDA